MIKDTELLRCYADKNSQAAFTELVGRYVNFVYTGALHESAVIATSRKISHNAFLAFSHSKPQPR